MLARIQIRRDTAANWTSINPVLAAGEFGVNLDNLTFKIGDGTTPWNDLAYATADISTSPFWTAKGQIAAASGVHTAGPLTVGTNGQVLTADSTQPLGVKWAPGSGSGTVSSVALADGSTTPIFTITGSPVTGSGTLTETLRTQTANQVFAGPTTGSAAQPTFRALVAADIPSINALLPTQTGNNGKFLTTDGSVSSWGSVASGISIGEAITGGTATRVIFQGVGPVLADHSGLTYDTSTSALSAGKFFAALGGPLTPGPGFAFQGSIFNGMYSPGSNIVALASGGDPRFAILATGTYLAQNTELSWCTGTFFTPSTTLFQESAGFLGQRSSTNPTGYNWYNTFTDASNYERGSANWSANVFTISTAAAGTGTARNIALTPAGGTVTVNGAFVATGNVTANFLVSPNGLVADTIFNNATSVLFIQQNNGIRLVGAAPSLVFGGSSPASTDLVLTKDASNTLAQRNGVNAQTSNIYNTFTDASNYEYGSVGWTANTFTIATAAAGTGTARDLQLAPAGGQVIVPRGTVPKPGLLFQGANVGFNAVDGTIVINYLTIRRWIFDSANTTFSNDALGQISWSNASGDAGSTQDLGLRRSSTGILQVDNCAGGGAAIQSISRTDPAAPAATKAVMYFRTNGGGKMEYCVRFPTGAVQVIATEP